MPDLTRDQIRDILRYLQGTTEVNERHLRRVLENPRALLKGVPDTEEERKFGNTIRVQEQKEFFERLAEEMQLSGRSRQQFEWAVDSRNISGTLRKAKEHAAGPKQEKPEPANKDEVQDEDDDGEPPKPKGFWNTMFGF